MKFGWSLLAPLTAGMALPGAVRACASCLSGALDGDSLRAYYTVTAFMTGTVLLLALGFYLFIYRMYVLPERRRGRAEGK